MDRSNPRCFDSTLRIFWIIRFTGRFTQKKCEYGCIFNCELMLICYRSRIVRKHVPAGVIVILAGIFLGAGCKGDSDVQAEAPSLGIPEGEYDLFSNLIRNIDAAVLKVERIRPTKNRVAIRKAEALLAKERETLNLLFTEKFGEETVSRWTAMVHEADGSMAKFQASQVKGEELLAQFEALGAKGQLDAEGYITHIECRNIILTDDMIARIANCSRLQDLTLRHTGFKDSHFDHLVNLTEITRLDLSDNPFSGEAISNLGGMTKLHSLNFSGTSISDANVKQFEGISHLKTIRTIDITGTKLSTGVYEKITRFFRLADVKF